MRRNGGSGADERRAPRARDVRRRVAWIAAGLGVAFLALAFRCWRLYDVPPGLYVDEVLTARNALAWRLDPDAGWLGSRPLLVPGWVETSNLYLAFASAVLALGGDGLLGVRLLSVLPSLAAVPLLCWLGVEVGGRRTGVLAAFLLACSHWAARSGRTGWDAVLMVTLQLAALGCLAAALRRDRLAPAAAAAAGGLLGLSLYTYVAARLAVLHAALWLAWEAVAARRQPAPEGAVDVDRRRLTWTRIRPRIWPRIWQRTWLFSSPRTWLHTWSHTWPRGRPLLRLLLCLAVAGAIAAPLLLRPGGASGLGSVRVAQLSALARQGDGEPWTTLGRNLVGHLAMFHLRGGAYARDALPGFPMLDPVSGILLLAGVVVVARGRGWPRRLLLSWPVVMVLGGVLSASGEGPPYPYRVLSLAPWACLVAALGGVALWDGARARLAPAWRRSLAALALLAVVAVNGWVLFVAGPADPGTRRVYGVAATRLGLWLAAHGEGRPVILLPGALAGARPGELASPPLPAGYPHAAANRTSFYRPVDTVAAVHLASGLYRRRPERALDPLRPAGDVDLLPALPSRLAAPSILVLPPAQAGEASRRFTVERRVELRDRSGAPLAMVLFARP